ncbi:MAG: glutamate racemase, partial [Oscillospiraceae bacterium]
MDNRPIGVFDSGLGGLTTVLELKRIMPSENIIYFGDTSRVPYGTRSRETIQKYTKQDIRFLLSQNVKMVIVACNTASTVVTQDMIDSLDVPFAQVLTPAVNSAAAKTKNKKI